MNYTIKNVTNKQELKNALTFGTQIFNCEPDFGYADYSDELPGTYTQMMFWKNI